MKQKTNLEKLKEYIEKSREDKNIIRCIADESYWKGKEVSYYETCKAILKDDNKYKRFPDHTRYLLMIDY